jgi:hypothetical protein
MSAPPLVLVAVDDARLRGDVEALHRQGPDVLFAFLLELAAERLLFVDIAERLRRHVGRDGDQLPARRPR